MLSWHETFAKLSYETSNRLARNSRMGLGLVKCCGVSMRAEQRWRAAACSLHGRTDGRSARGKPRGSGTVSVVAWPPLALEFEARSTCYGIV